MFGIVILWESWIKGQRRSLTFCSHKSPCTNLSINFEANIFKTFHEILHISNFYIWPGHKIGQGHPKVIIWTILVVLGYPMLHTKLRSHRSIGSGEDLFYSILSHNLGRSSGHHRWIRNNPFPSWPVFSCPSWAGKVHSCPLFDIVFPPLLLSASFSFSFHCAL